MANSVDSIDDNEIIITSGEVGGIYYLVANELKRLLAKEGIPVTVLESDGAIQNWDRLNNGYADIGIVQSDLILRRYALYGSCLSSLMSLSVLKEDVPFSS